MYLVYWGLAGLVLCVILIVSAIALELNKQLSQRAIDREYTQQLLDTHELALVENQLLDSLTIVAEKKHYRHNIHCPACGRFARRVPGFPDTVSSCKYHGVRARVGVPARVRVWAAPATAPALGPAGASWPALERAGAR